MRHHKNHTHDEKCCCHDEGCNCHDEGCNCHDEECCCHDEGCAGSGLKGDFVRDPEACVQREGAGFVRQDADKGVSLGKELEDEIAEVMTKRYARFLRPGESFSVKTEVCHHFGLVSSELQSEDRQSHVWIEASVECEPNKIENPMDAYQEALDVLDLVWLDYFDSDRISHYLPIWQSYEIDSKTVNVRLEHCNPALDDEAAAFLLAHGFTEGGLEPEPEDEEDY